MKRIYLLLLIVFSSSHGITQEEGLLNRLLAPGPLIEGHKSLEGSDCLKCHSAGKGISEEKCMACHKPIAVEVQAQKGFHGLNTDSCISCHTDHKGRAYDSTVVDQKTFDHSKTGYKLEGKHAELKCSECHLAKRTDKPNRKTDIDYIGTQSMCVSCHKKDDIHKYKGKWAKFDCNHCHGLKDWHLDVNFDHEEDAHYALEGKHAEIKCSACHKNSQYSWPHLKTSACLNCHADFHKNNLSGRFQNGKCQTCHGYETWKITSFNHKVTGYPLRGKHSQIQCIDCHKQNPRINPKEIKTFKFTGLRPNCLTCHKDFHHFGPIRSKKLGLLNQCLECHTETKWQDTHSFNHSVDTRFVIEGKHVGLDCAKCHIPGERKKPAGTPPQGNALGKYHWNDLSEHTCEVCHKSPHKNDPSPTFKQKKCDQCHVADGWHILNVKGKRFDHNKTRFALTGKHSEIACSACHVVGKKEIFHFEHFAQNFCVDCHRNQHIDQFHDKFSQNACSECHSTKTFAERLPFDHNKTAFPLKNKHAEVKCEQCHKPTEDRFENKPYHFKSKFIFPEMAMADCKTCHVDYHMGQLGSKCSTCHNDTGWKNVKFDHNLQSRFKITGKHIDVKCEQCHKPIKNKFVEIAKVRRPVILYKPIVAECITCHKDPHKGHFGNNCQECHMEKGWKLTKDFHKNFTLSGVHFSLNCQECHKDNRKLTGMSQECILCHQKDDIHQGTLPNCGTCHKQQFWEDVDFKHSLTLFPLRGAHRTLECAMCHYNNIYQGLNNQCINCHLNDANTATSLGFGHTSAPGVVLPAFMNCNQCHNQFTF